MLMEVPCYGAIWDTTSLALTLFVRWPEFKPGQAEIMDVLAEAYEEIENSSLPDLRAYRVQESGESERIDLWENLKRYDRAGTR